MDAAPCDREALLLSWRMVEDRRVREPCKLVVRLLLLLPGVKPNLAVPLRRPVLAAQPPFALDVVEDIGVGRIESVMV